MDDGIYQKQLSIFKKWAEEQLTWLKRQIRTMEEINKQLQENFPIDFLERYTDEFTSQNNKLEHLIQELELIKKELPLESLTTNNSYALIKEELTSLIAILIKINKEVFDKILIHITQTSKEFNELLSFKERFEKYSDKNSHPGDRILYDT